MRWLLVMLAAAAALPLVLAAAQPQIPSTFYGTATIDGKTPDGGADVRAFVDGKDCTQPSRGVRFVVENGVESYVIDVMHDSQEPGCGRDGKTVTFTIGGQEAGQAGTWKAGPQHLDLNAGSGAPIPLPTATPITPAAATATAAAASSSATPLAPGTTPGTPQPPPTDDIHLTPPSGSNQGGVSAAQASSDGDDDGFPAWAIIAVVGGVLVVGGGAAGWMLSRRRPPAPRE